MSMIILPPGVSLSLLLNWKLTFQRSYRDKEVKNLLVVARNKEEKHKIFNSIMEEIGTLFVGSFQSSGRIIYKDGSKLVVTYLQTLGATTCGERVDLLMYPQEMRLDLAWWPMLM